MLPCRHNPLNIFAAHEITGFADPSVATKMTVHFNLFGGKLTAPGPGLLSDLALLGSRHQWPEHPKLEHESLVCVALQSRWLPSRRWYQREGIVLHLAGTVLKLGTQQHHDQLLGVIDSLDATGCFGLTELGFGEPLHAA